MKTRYTVLGAMAGSSMDGLDLALVDFKYTGTWEYTIRKYDTIPYGEELHKKLKNAPAESLENQKKLDLLFGKWIGRSINKFLPESIPDILAVHGHTLIHAPKKKVSWQIGDGRQISSITGVPTITEFRSYDIQNGGQGAPLVPFGDFELFGEFDACLNLGGIANVSVLKEKKAWDICPCNQVLNFYANKIGKAYDGEGKLSRHGKIDQAFLSKIEALSFFKQPPPKSLPNSFISASLLNEVDHTTGLRSYTTFIANQIASDLNKLEPGKLLITGGGAFNSFLIQQIKSSLGAWEVIRPKNELISYKEALIFAFLGLKKFRGEINVYRSVTGAAMDSCSGEIHLPK